MKPFILSTENGEIELTEKTIELIHDYYEQNVVKDKLINDYSLAEDKASSLALKIVIDARKLHIDRDKAISINKQEIFKTKIKKILNEYSDYRFFEDEGYEPDADRTVIKLADTLIGGKWGDTFEVTIFADISNANDIKINVIFDEEEIGTVNVGNAETFADYLEKNGLDENEIVSNAYNFYRDNGPYATFVSSIDINTYEGQIFYFDNSIYLSHSEDNKLMVDQQFQFNLDESARLLNLLYDEVENNFDKVDIWSLPENDGLCSLEMIEKEVNSLLKYLSIDQYVHEDNLEDCIRKIESKLSEEENEYMLNRMADCITSYDRYVAVEEFYNMEIDQDAITLDDDITKNPDIENMDI